MPTSNFYIVPSDGWVQIADSPKFVHVNSFPESHPYYIYAGTSAPSLFAAGGTGTVTFTGLPVAAETVTIGSEVYTFRAAATLPFEVTIGADATGTAVNFVATVTANSTLVTATNLAGVVTVTAKAVGTQGNYALSEAATNTAVSGAALTGGVEMTQGVYIRCHPFEVNVTMVEKLYARIKNPVPNSTRANGELRLDVFTIA